MPTSNEELAALRQQARSTLTRNWRDGYTVPSPRLYPFQWNWDSGFIALGYVHFDLDRAKQELRSLFKGQWENGLLPHIVFHKEDPGYFPPPDMWQSQRSPHAPTALKTSGLIQPPVIGYVLEMMYRRVEDKSELLPFIEELYPRVLHSHRYLYEHRDLHDEGLIYIQHNWESGCDDSPLWDETLRRIVVEEEIPDLGERRRDTKHAAASERPTTAEYQKYLYLVDLFIGCAYDDACIARKSPFLIQEPLVNAMLIRSNDGLMHLAHVLGQPDAEVRAWNEASRASMNAKLWNADTHGYDAYDLRRQERITVYSSTGLIAPLFARVPDERQAALMVETLRHSFVPKGYYFCPSFLPDHEQFDLRRFWRGPVWVNTNWMLYHGLKAYGFDDLAAQVKADSVELVQKYGYYEYFNPRKDQGGGYGVDQFSWSAALFLDLIHD